ncbi:MAG: TetR/AcrR family transcriptional regulator [Rubrivivax sp.]|nr:TetR/AcrR family transcriptional regulator [Rubrivivax sp.]
MSTEATRLPAEERRALTIETVVALAGQGSPGEITTTAIAEHMNLTQGALFRHFPTKDSIWEAVIGWVSDRLLARTDSAAKGVASPLAALEAVFLAHIEFVAKHPGVPRMMFGELQRAQPSPAKRMAQQLMRRYGERLQVLIEQGQTQGEIEAQVDAVAAATLFIGMVQGLVMQAMLGGKLEGVRTLAPGAFAIYRRGIASAGPNPSAVAHPRAAPRSQPGPRADAGKNAR